MKIKGIAVSVGRLLPSFAMIAVAGCILAYFVLHVPLENLGVVVAVPVVIAFLCSRLLVLTVPRDVQPPTVKPSLRAIALAIPVFLSISTSTVMLLSAIFYSALGLHAYSRSAIKVSAFSALAGMVVCTLFIFMAWFSAREVHERIRLLFRLIVRKQVDIFWDVLRTPTDVAHFFSGHLRHRHL